MTNQRTVEEILEEFGNLPQSDNAWPCMECGGGIDEKEAKSWLRTTLETERRQADERLREVVGEILDKQGDIGVGKIVAVEDIKTIAIKHNIDITRNDTTT